DAVLVVAGIGAALLDEILPARLDITRVVFASRREQGFTAIPAPRPAEARVRVREDGRLQFGLRPRQAAISRDVDAPNRAAAGPRQAGDFVHARAAQGVAAGRVGDHRFGV